MREAFHGHGPLPGLLPLLGIPVDAVGRVGQGSERIIIFETQPGP